MRKIPCCQSLTFEELLTVLADIEATINSRPLTYDGQEPGEESVLTPSHLLTGSRVISLPEARAAAVPSSTGSDIGRRWRYRRSLTDAFWKRWRKEYLLQLRSAHCISSSENNALKPGDLVILQEDRSPSHMWKTGRISEVFKGRDGAVRSCIVKLPSGKAVRRPVQLLYPLETNLK